MTDSKFMDDELIELPADALPDLEELTGDLRAVAELIGVGPALKLAQAFCGNPIRLWGGKRWLRRYRDRRIRQEYDAGASVKELGMRYKLSERQIWNILGTVEPVRDERQGVLF